MELEKLNLIMVIFAIASAALNVSHFKCGQNGLKNNHLSLFGVIQIIRDTFLHFYTHTPCDILNLTCLEIVSVA